MTIPTDALSEEYTIDTPENVSIGYSVAGIGNRFIAALIDSLLLAGALILAQILLIVVLALLRGPVGFWEELEADWREGLVVALYALGTFCLIWGYFILFEWLWNGQTPGKRVSKIRVVRMDGSPPRFLDIAVRNLVRIIDFLPFGYGLGLVTMFFNREARRLGDMAAGVMVVKDRGELRLEDVTGPISRDQGDRANAVPSVSPVAPAVQTPADISSARQPDLFTAIRRLRVADYELMQESLRRHDAGTLDVALLTRLAQAMAQKAGSDLPPPTDWISSRRLLLQIMDAYRQYHA
jgi:uncharacterized RDD family membrane protein YckC